MGKVHGSLARAGKVKSQTPKVSYARRERIASDTIAEQILTVFFR